MKEIIIAFDIDGTLISNTNSLGMEHLNIRIYNLMVILSKMKNTKIIVWSGGGQDYAEQICRKYDLVPFIHSCHGKHEYDETISGHVDISIDDMHEFNMADKNIIVREK